MNESRRHPAIEDRSRLLVSISRFAESIDADERTARRHLQTGQIPLHVHRIAGMARISVEEATAWCRAGSPSRGDWVWPPEQPEDQRPAGAGTSAEAAIGIATPR